MLQITDDQPWSSSSRSEVVEDFERYGSDFPDAMGVIFSRLQPKPGQIRRRYGSICSNAYQADARTGRRSMYARLYWNLARQSRETLFTQAEADCLTLPTGFENMIKRNLASRNINGLAQFACLAADLGTRTDAINCPDGKIEADAWTPIIAYEAGRSRRDKAAA